MKTKWIKAVVLSFMVCVLAATGTGLIEQKSAAELGDEYFSNMPDVSDKAGLKTIDYDMDEVESLPEIEIEDETDALDYTFKDADWSSFRTNYYYDRFSDDEKKIYDALDEICLDFLKSTKSYTSNYPDGFYSAQYLTDITTTLDYYTVKDVAELFCESNPQYFFVRTALSQRIEDDSVVVGVLFYGDFLNYSTRTQAISDYLDGVNAVFEKYDASEKSKETEYDKALLAHDIICEHGEYGNVDNEINQSSYSFFVTNDYVCKGYADAYTMLCTYAGLDVTTVWSDCHAFNQVKIGNYYYWVDTTWDDFDKGLVRDGTTYTIIYNWFLMNDYYFFNNLYLHDFKSYPYTPINYEVYEDSKILMSSYTHMPLYGVSIIESSPYACNITEADMVRSPYYGWTYVYFIKPGTPAVTCIDKIAFTREFIDCEKGFKITLTSKYDYDAIYYTLDRTEPTEESTKYTSPIYINYVDSTTGWREVVLRARVYKDGQVIAAGSFDVVNAPVIRAYVDYNGGYYSGRKYIDYTAAGNNYNVYDKMQQNGFSLATPTRKGYTFKGWKITKNTTNSPFIIEAFNNNNGRHYWDGDTKEGTFLDASTLESGYTFSVNQSEYTWVYENDNLTVKWTSDFGVNQLKFGEIHLEAVWEKNTYTLTVDLQGGSYNGSSDNLTYTGEYSDTVTLPTPVREGYVFEGYFPSDWCDKGINYSIPYTYTFGKADDVNTTVCAYWSEKTSNQNTDTGTYNDGWIAGYDDYNSNAAYGTSFGVNITEEYMNGYVDGWNTAYEEDNPSYQDSNTYQDSDTSDDDYADTTAAYYPDSSTYSDITAYGTYGGLVGDGSVGDGNSDLIYTYPTYQSESSNICVYKKLVYSLSNKTATCVGFVGKKAKSTIKIPDTIKVGGKAYKVTSVAKKAFYNQKSIKKATLGKYVKSIGKNAFGKCKNLKSVTVTSKKTNVKTISKSITIKKAYKK